MSIEATWLDWEWKVYPHSNGLNIYGECVLTGDASGGHIKPSCYFNDNYLALPRGHHIFITHLAFRTNDITSQPNYLRLWTVDMLPHVDHNFSLPLHYVENQSVMQSTLADFVQNELYIGKSRKGINPNPSGILAYFIPNTNGKTYTYELHLRTVNPRNV